MNLIASTLFNFNPKKPTKPFVDYTKVIYFSAEINYTLIHFMDGSRKIYPYTIKRFEEYLSDNQYFVRIHRGYLVNKMYIKELSEYEVVMSSGRRLPVARRRRLV
jgi:DNA-binding LytR/AlgR family response regulator